MKLMSRSNNTTLAENLVFADSFWSRAVGLLGKKSLPETEALWIRRCNSIHTFFMQFPIDVVFVDKTGRVHELRENVPPYRIIAPVWKASDTIEFKAGTVKKIGIKTGDEVHVVP